MAAKTRLGPWGHGTRRTGSFSKASQPRQEVACAHAADGLVTQAERASGLLFTASAEEGLVTTATLTEHIC